MTDEQTSILYSCKVCGSSQIQVCLAAYFEINNELAFTCKFEQDEPPLAYFCVDCDETVHVIGPEHQSEKGSGKLDTLKVMADDAVQPLSVIPERIQTLLQMDARTTGTLHRSEGALSFVEEQMTSDEIVSCERFYTWLLENNRTFGWNLPAVWREWVEETMSEAV